MLTLCTVCSRHARADEACCPFCQGALAPPKPVTKRAPRAGRAAILFGVALTAASCGSAQSGESTTPEEEQVETPPPDDTTPDDTLPDEEGGGDDSDVGSPVALYGVPAPE